MVAPCEQIKVSLQLDLDNDATPPQVHRAVGKAFLMLEKNGVPLDGTKAIMVVLPGISEAAALLMAELHGRLGTFPNVLALRKVGDGTWGLAPQEGMYNGVLDLEKVRNAARERR